MLTAVRFRLELPPLSPEHVYRSRYLSLENTFDFPTRACAASSTEMLLFVQISALYSISTSHPIVSNARAVVIPSETLPNP